MSLLGKQNNLDKWKNKYFDLLDENEATEKSHQTKIDLLCKTIIRLSLATTGFNKELDPFLLRIRKQLKGGLKSEQLKIELEKFSNALMTIEDEPLEETKLDATLLFDFLFNHFPEQKAELQTIEVKFEKNEFPNSKYLFIAIHDLIDSVQEITPLPEAAVSILENDVIDFKAINSQLLQLIESLDIPEELQGQAKKLIARLSVNEASATIINDTASLLSEIKKQLQSEQQQMIEFLAQLTDQLVELDSVASGAHSAAETSIKKRNLLDQSVSSQMLELQTSSKNATQLEPLKQLIHTSLASISEQIQSQKKQEAIERDKTHQQLDVLTRQITSMEQESRKLKNKLVVAHKNAIHDPLTGLPNRLAYDERLHHELARKKRYKTALSLLIWDIDLFKHINDTFGHKAGDKTLILIASLLSEYCRESDFVSRFGGEEFTMLLADTDAQSALHTANKLRKVVAQTAFNSNGKKISITISCGITEFLDEDTGGSAFNRADKALYQAKDNGRNQCVVL